MKTALIIYWSKTGNTQKVADAIKQGLEETGILVTTKKPEEAEDVDYFDYDLVCVGCPSYSWHPPDPVTAFLKKKFAAYRQQGKIKPCAPKVPGKNALVFVTYSGPHTGIDEATPVGKDLRQYFEHIGFTILDEWYVLSEFHGSLENSTKGRMGDIRGKPTSEDLQRIKEDAKALAKRL
ncbi:MAG: flavodoxin domain-containing protein [Candidatus Bathyarchaeota archaeon]|nr:flavodoxin domain-containing protein [Candidatus Bathyarchaeota archaeon]